ncbi:alpha/beta fold hydrolase [Microlunatus soli]|uniref:Pimeloyl-ACP methyl ester carboxylesterase n=1 Tax=Microlunatus soli TaxID=630515 RepID=A0A1H1PAN4_9ACTN|nr:alpha/beta hydrolase [Microlunatus soli]SDS08140.1 Pimeloyl-ACP methyl ester carboxylesterase [Microlunatus soli]
MTSEHSSPWTETRYAHNGDISLAYDRLRFAPRPDSPRSAGSPPDTRAEPLLLIMGWAISRSWWPQGLVEAFAAQGFDVARYDNRDSGRSSRLPDTSVRNPLAALAFRRGSSYSFEDLADDAVAVLDALGWQRAHLFGHSMGGLIAQRVALRHPDRVISLTSSGAQPSDLSGLAVLRHINLLQVARFAITKHPDGKAGDASAAAMAMNGLASPEVPIDEEVLRAWTEIDEDSGLRDPSAMSRQLGATWHGRRLRELRTPTLIMHGLDDPLLKVTAAVAMVRAIPGAKLVVHSGVGHYIPSWVWPDIAREVGWHAAAAFRRENEETITATR